MLKTGSKIAANKILSLNFNLNLRFLHSELFMTENKKKNVMNSTDSVDCYNSHSLFSNSSNFISTMYARCLLCSTRQHSFSITFLSSNHSVSSAQIKSTLNFIAGLISVYVTSDLIFRSFFLVHYA